MRKLKTIKNKKRFKVIRLCLVIILVGIIVIVCNKKWNVWFGNPVEPPYASSNVPTRIQLTLGNSGQFSRNVRWQCGDTLAVSKLLIVQSTISDSAAMVSQSMPFLPLIVQGTISDTVAISAKGKIFQTQGGVTVSYYAELTDLTEGEYSYSVCTGDKQSDWYHFTVKPYSDKFRFVYIGDIQDTIGGTAGETFASINQTTKDADLWILGGDVIERPHDQYWNEYFISMDSISQTTPVIACPGNHEYYKGIIGKLDERFIHTFSYLIDSRNGGHAVFDTRYGNVAIIMLDSNRDIWTLFSQHRWFKKALLKSEDAQWKIVVLHHPVYSVRGKYNHLLIRRLFDPLMRKYGVDMVLQGHDHCYARMITKNNNNKLMTPVYLISHFSPKDYRIKRDEKYDRFGNEMRFYQTVDIISDTLSLKTYIENGELYDHVCIVKSNGMAHIIDKAINIPIRFNTISSRNKKK